MELPHVCWQGGRHNSTPNTRAAMPLVFCSTRWRRAARGSHSWWRMCCCSRLALHLKAAAVLGRSSQYKGHPRALGSHAAKCLPRLRTASTAEHDPTHDVSRAESGKPCLHPGRDQVRRSGISLWEIHGVQLEEPCPRPCPALCETLFKLSSSGNPVSYPGGPCHADFFFSPLAKD